MVLQGKFSICICNIVHCSIFINSKNLVIILSFVREVFFKEFLLLLSKHFVLSEKSVKNFVSIF